MDDLFALVSGKIVEMLKLFLILVFILLGV